MQKRYSLQSPMKRVGIGTRILCKLKRKAKNGKLKKKYNKVNNENMSE